MFIEPRPLFVEHLRKALLRPVPVVFVGQQHHARGAAQLERLPGCDARIAAVGWLLACRCELREPD